MGVGWQREGCEGGMGRDGEREEGNGEGGGGDGAVRFFFHFDLATLVFIAARSQIDLR